MQPMARHVECKAIDLLRTRLATNPGLRFQDDGGAI